MLKQLCAQCRLNVRYCNPVDLGQMGFLPLAQHGAKIAEEWTWPSRGKKRRKQVIFWDSFVGGNGVGGNRESAMAGCPSAQDRQTPYRQRDATPLVLSQMMV